MIQDKYTVTEVADKLKLSERTILREIKRGNLVPDKAGRRYVFDESEINRYLGKGEEDNIQGQINAFLEGKKGEMIDTLHRLVSVPSFVHKSEAKKEIIELINGIFVNRNIRSIVFDENNNYAVKATAGYHPEALVLTVPVCVYPTGNKNNWSHLPFDGVIEDGKLFARGAVVKANAVAMFFTLLAIKKHIAEEKFRIEVVFDTQDETGSQKALKSVLASTSNIASGVVGGVNDKREALFGGMGTWVYEITARGDIRAFGKVNAASKMSELIRYLEEATFPSNLDARFEESNLELISMHSDANLLGQDKATAIIAVNAAPSITKEVTDEVMQGVMDIISDKKVYFTKKLIHGNPGFVLGDDMDIVQNIRTSIESVTNEKPIFKISNKATSANELLANNIPAVIYGVSGRESLYDEYVDIDSIVTTSKVYAKVITMLFNI